MSVFRQLDRTVLEFMLNREGQPYDALRKQLSYVIASDHRRSPSGFFTRFKLAGGAEAVEGDQNFEITDVWATSPEIENGIHFLLFIRNGVISTLEGVTADSVDWPKREEDIRVAPNYYQPRRMIARGEDGV